MSQRFRSRNKVKGIEAEKDIAKWFEDRGFHVDHNTSHFSTGLAGFPDIVALKENLSLGIEVKSTTLHNVRRKDHKKENRKATRGEQYIGRIVFDVSAVQREARYCSEMGLKPIVIVLLRIKARPNLVWYYPFEDVLARCFSGRLSFSLSLYDVLEGGLPADHYLTHHVNDSDSNYRDMRNFLSCSQTDGGK